LIFLNIGSISNFQFHCSRQVLRAGIGNMIGNGTSILGFGLAHSNVKI